MNKLTNTEMRAVIDEALNVMGVSGARSVCEVIIDKEAEKVTSDIKDETDKRRAELMYMRMVLDALNDAYEEELNILNGGDEPTYSA